VSLFLLCFQTVCQLRHSTLSSIVEDETVSPLVQSATPYPLTVRMPGKKSKGTAANERRNAAAAADALAPGGMPQHGDADILYTDDVGEGGQPQTGPLDIIGTIRLACKHPQESEMHGRFLATKMEAMQSDLDDLVHQNKAKPLPPFVTQDAWEAMPDQGPAIPNKAAVRGSYAIIIAFVKYGAQEFPLGTRVRIRFHQLGHQGDVGVTCSTGPGGPGHVFPGVTPDMTPGAMVTVLIDGEKHAKAFRVCDVTLEGGPP
jgi:hypothetical protein